MKILFTGGSSFTGTWFIRALARRGHDVVATFRRGRAEDYPDAIRRKRVALALEHCRPVFDCSFGDARFLELAKREPWELLCHHAAEVTDYRSPAFDVAGALQNNTRNAAAVLDAFSPDTRVLITGSVFEHGEGAGSEGLPAFSPYGLSKGFTFEVFRYHAGRRGLALGKFVVPNPFGPYEEPRFTAYLMKTWLAGETASVATPIYVRDNIHVSLLAEAYARFAERISPGVTRFAPSGYVESQGAFATRFAEAMRPRLGLPCRLELKTQTDFAEPRIRINTDPVDGTAMDWDEQAAWDDIAAHYQRHARP